MPGSQRTLIDHSISPPAAMSSAAADQLEREVGLPVARAVGWPGADDVRDLFDHVLEVLAFGLVVGGEVQLIQRVGAGAAAPRAADRQQQARHDEQRQASDDQLGRPWRAARTSSSPRCAAAAVSAGSWSAPVWPPACAVALRVMSGRGGSGRRAFRSRADRGGERRERQRVQPADGARHQHRSGREPSGDRHDADKQPRGPHTFTNVSSTAAAASKAVDSAATARMWRAGSAPAPALEVEREGERVGGELDRAVRERGASHPRAVGAEAHADHHHVGRDATGEQRPRRHVGASIGCAPAPLRGRRGRASAPPAARRRWPAARGGCGRRPWPPRRARRGRPRKWNASRRRAGAGAAMCTARPMARTASGQRAGDPRRDPRRGYRARLRPRRSSPGERGGRARLADGTRPGCSSHQRSEDRLKRHLRGLDASIRLP